MPANADKSCSVPTSSWGDANNISSNMDGGRVRSPDRAVSSTGKSAPNAVVFAKTLNSCSTPARNASCLLPSSAASIQRRMPLNSFPRDTTWPNSLLCRKMPLTTCPTSKSSALTSGIAATKIFVVASCSGDCFISFGSSFLVVASMVFSVFLVVFSVLPVNHSLSSAAMAADSLAMLSLPRGLPMHSCILPSGHGNVTFATYRVKFKFVGVDDSSLSCS
mmetsp:Transcript_60497/g.158563  ORF Transcript_60497/g.158563 Transcript_60497/m.158563 type:complete len:220 (+) Transcript_60497:467-1126(+)